MCEFAFGLMGGILAYKDCCKSLSEMRPSCYMFVSVNNELNCSSNLLSMPSMLSNDLIHLLEPVWHKLLHNVGVKTLLTHGGCIHSSALLVYESLSHHS